jgi:hypothetical protein
MDIDNINLPSRDVDELRALSLDDARLCFISDFDLEDCLVNIARLLKKASTTTARSRDKSIYVADLLFSRVKVRYAVDNVSFVNDLVKHFYLLFPAISYQIGNAFDSYSNYDDYVDRHIEDEYPVAMPCVRKSRMAAPPVHYGKKPLRMFKRYPTKIARPVPVDVVRDYANVRRRDEDSGKRAIEKEGGDPSNVIVDDDDDVEYRMRCLGVSDGKASLVHQSVAAISEPPAANTQPMPATKATNTQKPLSVVQFYGASVKNI